MTEPTTAAGLCHPEGLKCLGDPLAEALGDSMVATDRPYTWRDLNEGYHADLLVRAGRVRKSLANRGLAIEAEARQQDGSALREALERFIEEYGDDALGTRFTVNDIVEWLAALPPSAPPALDEKGGCYFCGATGIASHAGCRGGNIPLPGDEDIERWYAAFAKVSGLDAKRLPGKRVIWERFAAEYARLQEQDR